MICWLSKILGPFIPKTDLQDKCSNNALIGMVRCTGQGRRNKCQHATSTIKKLHAKWLMKTHGEMKELLMSDLNSLD